MQDILGKQIRQNILVVESDQVIAEHLAEVIGSISSGYRILRATSGIEGLQKVEDGVVNIVLAAEKLVDMTGKTFINILHGMKSFKIKEPACVLMSEDCRQFKKSAVDCPDCVDIIKTPVDLTELAYTLDRAVDWDGLKAKIQFNRQLGRVLLGLVPVAVVVGIIMAL